MARGEPIKYRGEEFSSIRSLALHLGIPPKRLLNRVKLGWPEDEWASPVDRSVPKNFKEVQYRGKTFSSIRELAKHIGIEDGILGDRINKGLPEAEWGRPVKEKARPITYKGRVYETLGELAAYLGLQRKTLSKRIELWPEDEWHLPVGTKKSRDNKGQEATYQGKRYLSLTALAKHLDTPIETLRDRMKAGLPEEEWGKKKGVIAWNGSDYSSLTVLAKDLASQGLGSHTGIYKKLKQHLQAGMDINNAVELATKNLQNISIDYRGERYGSITELSKELGVAYGTLYDRVQNGWPESYWGVDRLPKAAPDFYFYLLNNGIEKGSCYFYVVEMRRFPGFLKVGVAWSLQLRRDAEYGEELLLHELDDRLTCLALEQAVLHNTRSWMSCPNELLFSDPPWIGRSEVRRMEWAELEARIQKLKSDLDRDELEEFCMKYIPLNSQQKERLRSLAH